MNDEHSVPTIKQPSFDIDRFRVVGRQHDRNELLKLFAERMPTMSPRIIAIWMGHIPTDQLMATYEDIDKRARNFGAYWNWCFNPKHVKK